MTLFVGILKHIQLEPLRKNLSGTFWGKVRAIFGLGTFASSKRDIFRPRQSTSVPACSRLQERSIQLRCSLQLVCWCLRATPRADDHDGDFLLGTPIRNMHYYTAYAKVCAPAELLTHLGHVFDVLVSRPVTPSHCVLAEPYEHNGRVPCSADVPKLFHVVPCDFCYGSLLLEEHIVQPAEAFTTGNHHLGHNLGPLHT